MALEFISDGDSERFSLFFTVVWPDLKRVADGGRWVVVKYISA